MKNNKILSILSILAILCILVAASTVTAASNSKYLSDAHDGHDGAIIPSDINHDEKKYLESKNKYLNETHNEEKMLNQTNSTNMTNTTPAVGGDLHNETNTTGNTTAPQKLPTTGNPIVALLLVIGAVVGLVSIKRRG